MEKFPGRGGGKMCAARFGVSPQQWSPWERGIRMPDELRLKQIAEFFGVTVDYLRRDNNDTPDEEHETPACFSSLPNHLNPFAGQSHLGGLDYFSLIRCFYSSVFKGGLTDRDITELSHDAVNRFLTNHFECSSSTKGPHAKTGGPNDISLE